MRVSTTHVEKRRRRFTALCDVAPTTRRAGRQSTTFNVIHRFLLRKMVKPSGLMLLRYYSPVYPVGFIRFPEISAICLADPSKKLAALLLNARKVSPEFKNTTKFCV